jgi:hypothetical protein
MEEKLKKELFIIYSICKNNLNKQKLSEIYDEYINKKYENSDYKITNIVIFTNDDSKVQIINPELMQTTYEKLPIENLNSQCGDCKCENIPTETPNSQCGDCKLILS